MSRLLLHIGLPKTGTTAIQELLADNVELLRDAGWRYPSFLDRKNHLDLVSVLRLDDRWCLQHARGVQSVDDLGRHLEQLRETLRDRTQEGDWVFSSEHLSSRLTRPQEVERLAEIFAHFDDVRIVIYVRPQDEMAAASYSTWVRDGQPVSFDIAHHITLENRYDFARIARRWANVFGQEALDIRLYPRRTLFEDFLSVIGVEETDKARWTSPPPSNVSLTDVELAFVLEMNRRLPRWSEGRPDNRFGNLTDVIEGSGLGERVTLSSAERNMILSRYQASNDWIIEHATNVEGRTDYFDAPRGEVPGNIHHQLSVDESNAFSAILWRAGARARSRLPGLSDK